MGTVGKKLLLWLWILLALPGASRAQDELERIQLPPGFHIERIARVPEAREMAWSPAGTLFIGSRSGAVYAATGYGQGQLQLHRLAQGLQLPVGVAFHDGDLYISAVNRILRLRDIERHLDHPPKPEVVTDAYPSATAHGWKFIAFGPDGMLYVPVGVPCNICDYNPDRYGVITRLDVSQKQPKPVVVARGIRNSVGFDWQPQTHELWFSDNGRDYLGDNVPPDELNHLTQEGQHFGFPFCHGRNTRDPDYGNKGSCAASQAPAAELTPHGAALGLRFYTGHQFPAAYRHSLFIAQHGSWNRSRKSGYRVLQVLLDDNGKVRATRPFATGWLDEASQEAWGRPADVSVAPDGALLVSDDTAGALYRISYPAATARQQAARRLH